HEDFVRVELIRLATESSHRLQTKDELSFRLHTAAFHFFVVGTLGPEPFDLLENGALALPQNGALHSLEPVAGRGRRGDLQKSGNLSRVLGCRYVRGNLLLEYEPAIETRGLAVGKEV